MVVNGHVRAELQRALRVAITEQPCSATRCERVQAVLEELAATHGADWLESWQRAPHSDRYARHPVITPDSEDFVAIAMVWGPGQGTAIHDHGGLWCVEAVLEGRIEVESYLPVPQPGGRAEFVRQTVVEAGVGAAGHLIPPFDHHVIRNVHPEPAVTLHVYGGPMRQCTVYRRHPEGGFEPESVLLGFDN